jgi:hypothetical protein
MKTKIALILIAGCMQTVSLFSQEYEYVPFPKSNAVWSEMYDFGEIYPECPPPAYERFTLTEEDTIINGKTYTKLYMFFDAVFNKNNAICVGGIREDENKRIFFKGTAIHPNKPNQGIFINFEEVLLYDFSVNVGDTITYENGNFYGDEMIVESVDMIEIGNSYRKKIRFAKHLRHIEWIEGIGSLEGLLFTAEAIATGHQPQNTLICFQQNDETLYFNEHFDDCFPFTGIRDVKKSDNQIIITQTNEGNIQFDFGEQVITSIQIFNSAGNLQNRFEKVRLNNFIC